MHKSPISFRFIASGKDVITSVPSKLLCSMLSHIESTLHAKDILNIASSGQRRHIITHSAEQAAQRINRIGTAHSLYTYDFSTLYTKFIQSDLINEFKSTVDEAFTYISERDNTSIDHLKLCLKSGFIQRQHETNSILSKSDIYELIHWVVSITYVHNGDLTFHQTIGLPMGTNAAPLHANLGLYRHERDFVTSHDDTVISTFNAIRFIDDILLIDPHHSFYKHIVSTSDDIDPIYPSSLQLSQMSASTTEVGYLGTD